MQKSRQFIYDRLTSLIANLKRHGVSEYLIEQALEETAQD